MMININHQSDTPVEQNEELQQRIEALEEEHRRLKNKDEIAKELISFLIKSIDKSNENKPDGSRMLEKIYDIALDLSNDLKNIFKKN